MLLRKFLAFSRCVFSVGLTALLVACSPSLENALNSSGVETVSGTLTADKPVAGLRYEVAATGEWFPVANTDDKQWTSLAIARKAGNRAAATDGAPGGSLWSVSFGFPWGPVPGTVSADGWASVAFSENGTSALAAEKNGAVWRFNGFSWTKSTETDGRAWCCVVLSPDGAVQVAAQVDGTVWVLDNQTGKFVERPSLKYGNSIEEISVRLYDPKSGGRITIFAMAARGVSPDSQNSGLFNRSDFSPDETAALSIIYANDVVPVVGNGLQPICRPQTSGFACDFLLFASSFRDSFSIDNPNPDGKYRLANGENRPGAILVAGTRAILTATQVTTTGFESSITMTPAATSRPLKSTISSVALTNGGEIQLAAESSGAIWQRFNPPVLFTDTDGKFSCIAGRKVNFYLGDKLLGSANCARQINVMQLVASNETDPKGVHITQLLKSVAESSVTSTISIPKNVATPGFVVSVDLNATDTTAFEASVTAVANAAGKVTPTIVPAADVPAAIAAALAAKSTVAFADDLCSRNPCRGGQRIANATGQGGTATLGGQVRDLGVDEVAILSLQWTPPSTTSTQSISMQISGAGNGDGTYSWAVSPVAGVNYSVSVTTAPQRCVLTRNAALYSGASINDINLLCSVVPTQLLAQVSGLPGTETINLQAAPLGNLQRKGNGLVAFEGNVISTGAVTYTVSVTGGVPVGYACSVANGSGTVPALATSVTAVVTCIQSQASLGGTVSSNANTNVTITAVTITAGTSTATVSNVGGGGTVFTLGNVPTGSMVEISASADLSDTICAANPTRVLAQTDPINITVSCTHTPAGGGGTTSTYTVGGTVIGVPLLTDIVLTMTSSDIVADGQTSGGLVNGPYEFLTRVTGGNTFRIDTTSPPGFLCTVAAPYATGATINANVTDADVTCMSTGGGGGGQAPRTISGNATNNTPSSRTILVRNTIAGSVQEVSVVLDANGGMGSFQIPGQVPEGDTYEVTAVEAFGDPNVQCSVTNATGTMGADPTFVSDVTVDCN